MEKHILWLLFLTGTIAQQGTHGGIWAQKSLFPKQTDTSYVILKPLVSKALNKLTVCLWSFQEFTRDFSLFSLATRQSDNAFLIYPVSETEYYVYIDGEGVKMKKDKDVLEWTHTCVSWDSETGVIQLWVNGKRFPRKVAKKGASISSPAAIILGQEQDSFGGSFDAKQSFVGEISDVHMWDYVLSPEDIQNVLSNKELSGNILSWRSLAYEIKGEVLILDKLQCKSPGYSSSLYVSCHNY
ncbi:C-reactive protein-like [Spea bombifrons]|uniref:C-reactive protein-like n=1 Tax=Spea bombifrons TaxID=233779 RepID=UPI00234AAAFF|nr:C-reactive protein-like [Spea bombifrons]